MSAKADLFEKAQKGDEADFTDEADRDVQADWIRMALLGFAQRERVDQTDPPWSNEQAAAQGKGAPEQRPLMVSRCLRLRGARIVGMLDLAFCGSPHQPLPSLSLENCDFQPVQAGQPNIDLSDAYLCALSLAGSRLRHLRGVATHIDGTVDLSRIGPLEDQGECWCKLTGAYINGYLIADALNIRAPARGAGSHEAATARHYDYFENDWGINLYMTTIVGSVLMRSGPTIEGGFNLDCAHIAGDVRFDAATLRGSQRSTALSMDRTVVGGSLTLAYGPNRDTTNIEGTLWMWQNSIGGSLEIMGAKLRGGLKTYDDNIFQLAVYACFTRVSGSVTIQHITANGLICLQGLQAGTYLKLTDVKVTEGAASLPGWFRVPTWFDNDPTKASHTFALDMRGVEVATTLTLTNNQLDGGIDLSGASCTTLDDDRAGYQGASVIMIDGLSYERLEHFGSKVGEYFNNWRLHQWLPINSELYAPQPFAQLARVLSHHGDEAHARDVLVHKARMDTTRRWYTYHPDGTLRTFKAQSGHTIRMWVRRAAYYLLIWPYGFFFGFGLSPARALVTMVLAILSGWLAFSLLNGNGLMVVAQTPVAGYVSTQGPPAPMAAMIDIVPAGNLACADNIRPLLYATDVFIPLVDLREEGKCDVDAVYETAHAPWIVTGLRLFKAAYALLGWLVTTLALLTFSGVLRNRLSQD